MIFLVWNFNYINLILVLIDCFIFVLYMMILEVIFIDIKLVILEFVVFVFNGILLGLDFGLVVGILGRGIFFLIINFLSVLI